MADVAVASCGGRDRSSLGVGHQKCMVCKEQKNNNKTESLFYASYDAQAMLNTDSDKILPFEKALCKI